MSRNTVICLLYTDSSNEKTLNSSFSVITSQMAPLKRVLVSVIIMEITLSRSRETEKLRQGCIPYIHAHCVLFSASAEKRIF